MANTSKIEWTDTTWNPLAGCSRVSPGCDNCYAARETAGRLSHLPLYKGLTSGALFTGEIRLAPERLEQPLHWRRPRRVFVNSMSDLFHPNVPTEYIAQVFAVMALASSHQFQVLTKRPQRMRQLVADDDFYDLVTAHRLRLGAPLRLMPDWPRPNIWLGVSIESDAYVWRADHLRDTPAAVRFVSAEPLIGPLPSLNLDGIDWVIVGGESGDRHVRPMHIDWARDLRDRCNRKGVAFLFKQHGEHRCATIEDDPRMSGGRAFTNPDGSRQAAAMRVHLSGRHGVWVNMKPGDVTEGGNRMLDETTMAVRVGKRAAGRELDGRTWDEYPEVHP